MGFGLMRYDYECGRCHIIQEIIKSLAELEEPELCECGLPMVRVISPIQISPSAKAFEAHHNWAFGKVMTSKRQMSEEVSRIRGETGRDIVEVGSDDLKSVKKPYKKYTVDGFGGLDGHS